MFCGKNQITRFLQQQLKAKKGDVIEISSSDDQFTTYEHQITSFDSETATITDRKLVVSLLLFTEPRRRHWPA